MKYCYRFLSILLLLVATFVKIQAQGDTYRVVKGSNGQSYLLTSKGPADRIYTDLYFRTGTVYEFDSTSGICQLISKTISTEIDADIKKSGRQVKYSGTLSPEQIGFHFESGMGDLDYVLTLIHDKILHPVFREGSLETAQAQVSAALDSLKAQDANNSEARVAKIIWGKDYDKLNLYGDRHNYARLKVSDLAAFHKKYFLPFNNTVSILGSYNENEVLDKAQNAFNDFQSREFNPELITRVIDFKPIVNTLQFISKGSDKNLATVTYQNPGARQDRNATYSAFLLMELINDKNGRIQKTLKAAGLKDVKAVYNCDNFYGTFVISAQPADNNFNDAFTALSKLITDFSQKEYFKQEELDGAKKNIQTEFNALKANNINTFMSMVAKYRFSNDENYFAGLADSIKNVTLQNMRDYVGDYFIDHAGVRNLSTSDDALKSAPADQQYYALNESTMAEVKFTYELNKNDIDTGEGRQNLQRVIQWLRINPDIHVQINGFSDEHEYTKAYDDSVIRFIDSTVTFHKAMPDVTRKGYLRLEFMRAMKIAKALYQAGITEDRISGTSMVFTSDSKEDGAVNRKCTLTFEKIKPRLSLYEYHFGKKKEGESN